MFSGTLSFPNEPENRNRPPVGIHQRVFFHSVHLVNSLLLNAMAFGRSAREDFDRQIIGNGSARWLPYLFLRGPEGYVSQLFVGEAARGQGVGRKLLQAIEAEARARGGVRLALINLRNRESYRRNYYIEAGWKERAEAANYIYIMP